MTEREIQIKEFLEKWNDMLDAALKIQDFSWDFKVVVSSDHSIIGDRRKLMSGINESFTTHGFNYTSSES